MMNSRNLFKLTLCLMGLTLFIPRVSAENWQYRLPDDTYVALLSIPGTHDSATGSGFSGFIGAFGSSYAQTQETTIAEQWSQGIRAFDFRPAVYDGYMNLNHGIMPTTLKFEETMYQLRDSLKANPTEFIIIHLLHASDGDESEDSYNDRIMAFMKSDEIKDYLIDFKRALTVGEMRGKILILSRDKYASKPVAGGILQNWRTDNVNWAEQTQGKIQGSTSILGTLYMQDYSDTHREGGIQTKLDAIGRMLDFSTTHKTTTPASIRWIFNFLSAYSKVASLFGTEVSTSDGYRDNATHTHAFVLDYLSSHKAGPMGIILMDYAGVDKTGQYETRGRELVQAIIDNNFGYLEDVPLGLQSVEGESQLTGQTYDLSGRPVNVPQKGLYIRDGKKVIVR